MKVKKRISCLKNVVQEEVRIRGDPGGIFYKLNVRLYYTAVDYFLQSGNVEF